MSGYRFFANSYDSLTSDIPYRQRGEYFHALFRRYVVPGPILLDLGCGTGSLSEVMADLGYEVIGVDGSSEMLVRAAEKKYASGRDILYLCQDMQELDLYGTVDCAICALDSLNHLVDPATVQETLRRVSLFLAPGGVFVFDVNTSYKHERVLAGNTFVYDYDEVYCVWQNSDCRDGAIEMTLDLFVPGKGGGYERQTETFWERAYSHEDILKFLRHTNLELLDCFHADTLEPPRPDSERVVYAVRRNQNPNP